MTSRLLRIPSDIAELLHRGDGIVDVDSALAAGVSLDRLVRLVKAGHLTRVADGVYTSTELLWKSSDWRRHGIKARAFVRSCGVPAYLTGWSAAAVWDLPTLGSPPRKPAAVRPKNTGRGAIVSTHGTLHAVHLPPDHQWRKEQTTLVSPEWAAATIALNAPVADALVVADAVVRDGRDLQDAIRHMPRWPGVTRARWVAAHADPLAESPLETLGRFCCIVADLPMPVSNAWVGVDGPTYRLDGLWPFHWAGFEADGALKYDNRPDASYVVAHQNEREWVLRRLGLDLARYTWDLAYRQRAELATRFGDLLRDNAVRAEPVRWWKHVPGHGPVEPSAEDWPSPHPVSMALPAGWQSERRRHR
ncbi:type IV toxin-antitoxin system AbiEi family antitoxin domain-containing protein [Phytoactinopolyspora alkaliphila]|uniref:Type IV toxin-antitoxin system AbiEi family antitoxin domain-containing protein n=1 Tax=Phytoactinopolyspora alkaliphila TaxID=1783498 RepID=A0A6N9YH91_9ACTN|nr:type IV toxin-antitoxin system AbiEi family antitoxin domain-containing protein [Phytoactinopolyspora alkaliphila]NED94322.1 type IV toxin-antitoxin system AbiEi family antitoxin domain-containing protein [Phytoactinopolyspora alkaliphila]